MCGGAPLFFFQEKLRDGVVVKGKKDAAVSELAEGRRTIVRDPDDPAFEANILDSLMVSREDEIAAELETAYLPVRWGVQSIAELGRASSL